MLVAVGGVARSDQGWQDNQDGNDFACYDAASFAANNLNLSGGTYSTYSSGLIVNSNPNASTAAWFIDPSAGSDANSGLSGHPLKTNAEWSRRLQGATVGFPVVTYLSDVPDADTLYVPTNGGFLTFQGTETILGTQTVTSAQPRTPASNLANEITVTGFNWTPFLNDYVRVQGTDNYAAIIKVVGTGVARLGELWDTVASVQAAASGIGAGAVVEICKPTKGPLSFSNIGSSQVFVQDMSFDGAGSVLIATSQFSPGSSLFRRVIVGGTSGNILAPGGILWQGGLMKSPTLVMTNQELQGTAFTSASVAFQGDDISAGIVKIRSPVFETTQVSLVISMHVDADMGQFDIPAAGIGIKLPGVTSTGEGAILSFNSGRHYGTGDSTAHVWSVGNTTKVFYQSGNLPTNTAGLGVRINGGDVALSSLPVSYSNFNDTAAVDNTATAGCLQTDSAGNVTSTGSSCGGSGAVSLVTGTAQRVSASPTTGAVVVDTIGGYYSGALSGGNEDLGTTLTNGLVCNDTTAGIAVLRSCVSGTDYQPPTAKTCTSGQFLNEIDVAGTTVCATPPYPVSSVAVTAPIVNNGTGGAPNIGISLPANQNAYGTGTNVTSSSSWKFDPSTQNVYVGPISAPWATGFGEIQYSKNQNNPNYFVIDNPNTGNAAAAGFVMSQEDAILSGPYAAFSLFSPGYSIASLQDALLFDFGLSPAPMIFSNLAGSSIDFTMTGSRTLEMRITSAGAVQMPTALGTGGFVVSAASTGQLSNSSAGIVLACSNLPALTGDITTAGGTCATVNPIKGKVWVDAADAANNAPDYLAAKVISSATIAVTPVGSHDQQLQLSATGLTKHDYFVNTASLQPVDTTRRYAATSQSLMDYSGVGAIEYPNDFLAGHVAYKFNIIQSVGVASSMDCWVTLNGSNITASDFNFTPGTTTTGVYTVAAVATGSSSVSDVFGFACTYNGNFVTGPFGASIAFAVQEVLTP